MLAGGNEFQVEQLYRFGLGIGMAFQVIDDTLDYIGKQSKVGKPVMRDLREGKLTLPVIYCLNLILGRRAQKNKEVDIEKN